MVMIYSKVKNCKGIATLPIVLIAEGVLILILTLTVFIPHFRNDEKIRTALIEKSSLLEEKEKDIANLATQLKNLSKENETLISRLNTIENKLEDAKSEISILRNENEKLQKEKEEFVKASEKRSKESKSSNLAKGAKGKSPKPKTSGPIKTKDTKKPSKPQWTPPFKKGKG